MKLVLGEAIFKKHFAIFVTRNQPKKLFRPFTDFIFNASNQSAKKNTAMLFSV